MSMAVVLDQHAEQEVEAVLAAMESAVPGSRAEHLGGSYTLNRQRTSHQYTQMQLAIALQASLRHGLSVITEPRVHHPGDDNWIVPDLVVAPTALITQELAMIDPADVVLIAEVLSPTTETADRSAKPKLCERFEIDYWLVEPGRPWASIEVIGFGHSGIVPPPPAIQPEP